MAREKAFSTLVSAVKLETGRLDSATIGVDEVANIKRLINRWYELLWYAYDWPFLKTTFAVSIVAGTTQYNYPSGLDLERIERVWVEYNDINRPLERGINFEDFNIFDPADNERNDPILRWDTRIVSNVQKIEVWPEPNATQTLNIIGFKQWAALVADADVCYLDDQLVIMFASAQILKRQKSDDADALMAAANKHLNTLRGRTKVGEQRYRIGLGTDDERPPYRAVVYISGT